MNRKNQLEHIRVFSAWDIIVIGGGATGLGIAVDAAQRGFKVLLLEKNDFAKGTSSRSTKLVHGGVRYLAQGNIKLVVEALRERGFMLANAPHLTRIQEFVIPVYTWFDKWFYGTGLFIYDFLSNKLSLGRPYVLGKTAIIKEMPSLKTKGLKGAVVYTDGQFDDARFAISLALTAHDLGATVLNYVSVTALEKSNGIVTGVFAKDELSGEEFKWHAKAVINATGVFVDSILDMDDPSSPAAVMPSQGVHLVIGNKFFNSSKALMIPKTKDRRVLFALPWHGEVVIGTTDTALNSIDEEPVALDEEIDFIINHFNEYNTIPIQRKDIQSVFAGLRPLVKTSNQTSTALASRDHTLWVSKSRLITITGGKWTTYRKMAKDAVNNAAFVAKLPVVKCATRKLKLHGYSADIQYGEPLAAYGSDAAKIRDIVKSNSAWGELLVENHPYIKAEVVWAVQEEMAMTIEDVLSRRIRLLFLNAKDALTAAPQVAKIMASLLGQNEEWIESQISSFEEVAKAYLPN